MKELIILQSRLKAPKDKRNTFGGYNYRSAESILEALKPLLNETECTLTITDDIVMLGTRFYIKATVTLKNSKGEQEEVTAYAREEEMKKGMDGSQITGAASSYARKYALNGMFAIDDTKDADFLNNNPDYTQTATAKKPEQQPSKLDIAISRVKACTDLDALTKVYYECKELQKVPTFIAALTTRKNELTNTTK